MAENGNVIQAEDRTSTTDTAESSVPGEGESMSQEEDWMTTGLSDNEEEGKELGSGARVGADEPLDSSTLRCVIQQ